MKIFVTGGAGFIGSHVVDAYVELGHEVMVVDDLSTGKVENLNSEVRFEKMDIRDQGIVKLLTEFDPDIVNHHAAHILVGKSVADPAHDAEVNIMGTLNLMQAAIKAKTVKHIVFASTGGAMYGNKPTPFDESMMPQPFSPYGISKRAAELYLYFFFNQYEIGYTSLRYANVYGPRQNPHGEAGVVSIFIENLLQSKQPVINGDGTQTRDYVYVGDVARANAQALESMISGEFNIGTGIETDVNQIYQLVSQACNKGHVVPDYGSPRPGEQQTSSLDCSKAKNELGWKPSIDLQKGIKLTAEYFLQAYDNK